MLPLQVIHESLQPIPRRHGEVGKITGNVDLVELALSYFFDGLKMPSLTGPKKFFGALTGESQNHTEPISFSLTEKQIASLP